jgi:hypothetical protein
VHNRDKCFNIVLDRNTELKIDYYS